MTRRLRPRLGVAVLALGSALAGCAENTPTTLPSAGDLAGSDSEAARALREAEETQAAEEKQDILRQVVSLIRSAATNPAGDNFTLATESLNDYFRDTRPEEFSMPEPLQAFLGTQAKVLPPEAPEGIMNPRFSGLLDGRHIEDCMMYRNVARSIVERAGAEAADDLTRARLLFDWVCRQITLVPPGSLGLPNLQTPEGVPYQAQARPYDVLLRGLATEVGGNWAERSWLFMALCRQVGLDAAYLAVVPPQVGRGVLLADPEADPDTKEAISLGVGVLIGGQVYLFDARLGVPIPGPGGEGVATLAQAANDPTVLAQLDLPERPYPVRPADLAQGKVSALLEANLGSLSPRMRLLQQRLTGANRMVLYRDPSEVASALASTLGDKLESVQLWPLTLGTEYRLFHDGQFTQATLYSIRMFDPSLPLLAARLTQLRGDTDEAITRYVSFLNVDGLLMTNGKTPIPPEVGEILNQYATYFLALAQLDKGRDDQARFLFEQTLRKLPRPVRGRPYFYMFRWGALANLGHLCEEEGHPELAVRYYSEPYPTDQWHGNRLHARELIFDDPFVPSGEVPALPEAPEPGGLGGAPGTPVAAR